jgi:hypothetical protein
MTNRFLIAQVVTMTAGSAIAQQQPVVATTKPLATPAP